MNNHIIKNKVIPNQPQTPSQATKKKDEIPIFLVWTLYQFSPKIFHDHWPVWPI
jgi:hypothetical protein